MYNTPQQGRRFKPNETYLQIVEKSIVHAEELLQMLRDMRAVYPMGIHNSRDLFRTRNCILCALESLM